MPAILVSKSWLAPFVPHYTGQVLEVFGVLEENIQLSWIIERSNMFGDLGSALKEIIEIHLVFQKGKVLLYCKDGESIAPAFAISYLMFKAKLDIQMATLKVCQAISRVELNKMVYTQLLVYKPKK